MDLFRRLFGKPEKEDHATPEHYDYKSQAKEILRLYANNTSEKDQQEGNPIYYGPSVIDLRKFTNNTILRLEKLFHSPYDTVSEQYDWFVVFNEKDHDPKLFLLNGGGSSFKTIPDKAKGNEASFIELKITGEYEFEVRSFFDQLENTVYPQNDTASRVEVMQGGLKSKDPARSAATPESVVRSNSPLGAPVPIEG